MRKTPSALFAVLSVLCALSLFAVAAYAGDDDDRPKEHANGIVQDWSHHHVVFPRFGEIHSLIAVQDNPRAQLAWQHSLRQDWRRNYRWRHPYHRPSQIHTDWSISLGSGTTAPAMYPAKFTFDINAAPSCLGDFIVYPVNVAGGAAQPNIVGFNQLYSGTVPSNGICNRVPSGSDTGVAAEVMWSYNVKAGGGIAATSPALSLDGTKVAFVETGGGSAHFHVLAWKSGDGVDATNLQSVTTGPPKQLTSGFDAFAPVAASGSVTDLTLGSADDTLSSPFIDYARDLAYVGNDAGVIFRINNVFCTSVFTSCTPGTSAAPALDGTWGTAGALTIGGTCTGGAGKLTGVVVDNGTGNIFVGCADGKLYGFDRTGTALAGSPLTVGNGGANGGIVDPPLIDAVNKLVYVAAGNSGGGKQVVVQASTVDLSSVVTATLAAAAVGSFNLHAPAFNDNYFTSGTASTWLLYEVADDFAAHGALGGITLYGITFSAGHVMTSGAATNSLLFPPNGKFEISPMTTFLSSAAPAEDRLFESALTGSLAGNLVSINVSGAFPVGVENNITEGSGTTGIIVDNASASNQADSIYFGVLVSNTAVKLTQGALQ